jgi:hypothetical protein
MKTRCAIVILISLVIVISLCFWKAAPGQAQKSRNPSAPATVDVITDSFTASEGADLAGHEAETGQYLYRHYKTVNESASLIFSGKVTQNSRGWRNIYYYDFDLPADTRTCVDIGVRDATETNRGIAFRIQENDERYMSAGYSTGRPIGRTGNFVHGWWIATNEGYQGTENPHETVVDLYPEVLAIGSTTRMCIEAAGNLFTLTANGQPRLTKTNSIIQGAGYTGTYSEGPGSATAGNTLDNLTVTIANATPTPSPTPYPSPTPSPSPGSFTMNCSYDASFKLVCRQP